MTGVELGAGLSGVLDEGREAAGEGELLLQRCVLAPVLGVSSSISDADRQPHAAHSSFIFLALRRARAIPGSGETSDRDNEERWMLLRSITHPSRWSGDVIRAVTVARRMGHPVSWWCERRRTAGPSAPLRFAALTRVAQDDRLCGANSRSLRCVPALQELRSG